MFWRLIHYAVCSWNVLLFIAEYQDLFICLAVEEHLGFAVFMQIFPLNGNLGAYLLGTMYTLDFLGHAELFPVVPIEGLQERPLVLAVSSFEGFVVTSL